RHARAPDEPAPERPVHLEGVADLDRVDQERAYADRLADAIGDDPHFVIDVSRNGQGWRGTWCNPDGAGLGQAPHVTRGSTRLDALLWVNSATV
ncbi:glycoside hydrolase family 6 protein, partial [Bacillus sp. S34]|nr:glycoside hydrolase family 6 protein [Bacillus sp. S34]